MNANEISLRAERVKKNDVILLYTKKIKK